MTKRIILSLIGLVALCGAAFAQTPQLVRECVGTAASCMPISAAAPLPVTAGSGGLGSVTQGTKGTNAQAWWMQIGDGTNGPAKVQAGNSAAASDLAVTVSDPNVLAAVQASIPAGTNIIGKVGLDQTTNAGAALVNGGVATVNGGSAYETVAASQTAQAMGATGGTGDYLSHCVIYPTTTTPGVVTVFDNTNAAGSNVIAFPGGASSVSNLAPIAIPVGAVSTAGAWKVTTGANVVVTCYGKFT